MVGVMMHLWVRTKENSCRACIALEGTLWPIDAGPVPPIHDYCGCFRLLVEVEAIPAPSPSPLVPLPAGGRRDRQHNAPGETWRLIVIGPPISRDHPTGVPATPTDRAGAGGGGHDHDHWLQQASDWTATIFQRGSDEFGHLWSTAFTGPAPQPDQPYSLRAGQVIAGPALVAIETAIRARRKRDQRHHHEERTP